VLYGTPPLGELVFHAAQATHERAMSKFDRSITPNPPVRLVGSEFHGKRATLCFEAGDGVAQMVAEYLGRVVFLAVRQNNRELPEVEVDDTVVRVGFIFADDSERAHIEMVTLRIKRIIEALHGLSSNESLEVLLRDAFLDVFFRINSPNFERALAGFVEDEISPMRQVGTVH
jgi:hypothetical protein